MLGLAPVVAMFILFELVVFNPYHPETPRNQAFLHIIAGYWVRLDVISDGQIAGQLLAEFASIARDSLSRARAFGDGDVEQLRSPAASTTEQFVLSEDLTSDGLWPSGVQVGDQASLDAATNEMNGIDDFPLEFPLPDDWFDNGMFEGELGLVDMFGKAIG